ncbi:N-acetylmuramic acid 6-phosphate etherase [Lederbergia wuyishanensis]|uniref:N-acetylmuramic acid 6-phosphate etherase n=1 Tax=Lederbergia wuyishanensis TaxID=1347903 RepID=A0ABU0D3R0_9BACI|nr:N-acetylmuramic acid 6-phosphate etherase [Lederbergia wuyishanensis]MCJ8007793.1 N-acetylmuramic acid 6-phosphate etherase [Lederbergia wuyishanensis]MDQ0343043.1 N-acetylmuramic acid 6-phosphate etherase [Lederbergia wuyishanensis]
MQDNLSKLTTEQINQGSINIDQMSSLEIIKLMNAEDQLVAEAVNQELHRIAAVIDAIYHSFKNDGRLFYIGAGTSGRLGILDASECPPTFCTPPEMVQGIIAGGEKAIKTAIEGAEDSRDEGANDLKARGLSSSDIVVGLAASGRTPYVIGALEYARRVGAVTVALSCNKNAEMSQYADHKIEVEVGPEVLTGSTRLKAATAQKMVLNMLTTASMIKMGKVYNNLMVDLHASNKKLMERACRMVMNITGVSLEEAETALHLTNLKVKPAILMILGSVTLNEANQLLQDTDGFLREAIIKAKESRLGM